jgi:hypothetical protein
MEAATSVDLAQLIIRRAEVLAGPRYEGRAVRSRQTATARSRSTP